MKEIMVKGLDQGRFACLAALAFFTPWTYWPISKWLIFPFYDISYGLLVVLFLLGLLLPRPRIPRVGVKEVVLALLIFWILVNVKYFGSFGTAKPVIEMLILLYVIAHCNLSKIQTERLLALLLAGGAVVSGIAVYQYYFVSHMPVSATLANPNLLSGYLSLLLPLSLGFWFHPRPVVKVLTVICTTLLGLAMTISMTRTGWLVTAGAMVGFAVLKERKLLIVILIYLLLFGTIIDNAKNRFSQIKDITEITRSIEQQPDDNIPVQTSVGSRISLWRFALREFSHSPLTGIGIGNYREHLAQYLKENPAEGIHFFGVEETHNSYVKFLVELGLPGLILLLLVLFFWFGPLAIQLLKGGRPPLEVAVFWGMTAFLLHNMTNNLFLTVPTAHAFWVALGLRWNMNEDLRT